MKNKIDIKKNKKTNEKKKKLKQKNKLNANQDKDTTKKKGTYRLEVTQEQDAVACLARARGTAKTVYVLGLVRRQADLLFHTHTRKMTRKYKFKTKHIIWVMRCVDASAC